MLYKFSTQLSTSKTLEELAVRMETKIKAYGFSGFVYWTYLRLPTRKIGKQDSFVLSRGPAYLKVFEAIYVRKKLYIDDPVTGIASERTTPFTTLEIRQQKTAEKPTKRQRFLYALERRFGFVHDIYIPIHTPLRIQVFYAYFQGNDTNYPELVKKNLPQLYLDVALFSASIIDFIDISANKYSAIIFSSREQECLAWMAKGRSNTEIAQILKISEHTVKFHIKNILQKIHAGNRTEAIAIAARSGWLPN
jgi:DNA-binding CsgD family transcriptional regulator